MRCRGAIPCDRHVPCARLRPESRFLRVELAFNTTWRMPRSLRSLDIRSDARSTPSSSAGRHDAASRDVGNDASYFSFRAERCGDRPRAKRAVSRTTSRRAVDLHELFARFRVPSPATWRICGNILEGHCGERLVTPLDLAFPWLQPPGADRRPAPPRHQASVNCRRDAGRP